jgi:hypothetical protein
MRRPPRLLKMVWMPHVVTVPELLDGHVGLDIECLAIAEPRVTCCCFYLGDEDFGGAFIKVCSYSPYPVKVCVNGHEWAERQVARAGTGFTELSDGFASCTDPAAAPEP